GGGEQGWKHRGEAMAGFHWANLLDHRQIAEEGRELGDQVDDQAPEDAHGFPQSWNPEPLEQFVLRRQLVRETRQRLAERAVRDVALVLVKLAFEKEAVA